VSRALRATQIDFRVRDPRPPKAPILHADFVNEEVKKYPIQLGRWWILSMPARD
jgi:hypothetical protein